MVTWAWAGRAWVMGALTLMHLRDGHAFCSEYFNFPSVTDLSVLSGKWVTVASTRRVMPCHTMQGFIEPNATARLEEKWLVSGWAADAWSYSVTDRVVRRGNHLEVIQNGFDGVLFGGRVDVGVYEDKLLLVQCNEFLWVPVPLISVLARTTPTTAKEDVRAILDHFQVPKTSLDMTLVQHEGCEQLATPAPSLLVKRTLEVGSDHWALFRIRQDTDPLRIVESPDKNIV